MAKKPLTKGDIIDAIASATGGTKKDAAAAYECIVSLVVKNAKNDITLPGLGKFSVASRKARTGRNPQTGETIKIKAKKVVRFKVGKGLQDAVYPPK